MLLKKIFRMFKKKKTNVKMRKLLKKGVEERLKLEKS